MTHYLTKALLLGAAAMALPATASAGPAGVGPDLDVIEFVPVLTIDPIAATDAAPAAHEAQTAQTAEDADVVSDDELAGQRGGQTIQLTNQTMIAISTGNILNGDYVAGAVSLSDNALSNFNGIGNLLINTGAQASLQTGMNFTINVGE